MQEYSDAFNTVIQSSTKESRWVVEIALDEAATDLIYFTSHKDVPVPSGSAVVHEALQDVRAQSQRLNLFKLNSSIGDLSFSLVNLKGQVEAQFRGKRSAGKHLYGKRVRLIRGAKSLLWSDYITEQTQWISKKFDYRKGKYSVSGADTQSFLDHVVFRAKQTRLAATIDANATTVPVYSTDGFNLVQHDADFLEAPNELCTFFEISHNKKKEFIKVTAISTGSFTVERGAFGTTPLEWSIPQNASQDRGPKIREMVAVEMNLVKFAWAFLTGEDLDNPGTQLFPDHWHCQVPTSQLVRAEFVALKNSISTKAQQMALKKSNGKQFFEEQVLIPLGHYLRVNGLGVMNLKALHAIHADSNVVGTIKANQMIKYGDLTHDSSSIVNRLNVHWSWDERPSKPHYRRETPFVVENSLNEFGEREKTISLQLINGSSSTSSTLLAIANRYMDLFAGDAAYFSINVQHKLSAYDIGDVLHIEHHAVSDYTGDGSLGRAMMVIDKRIDQKRGITLNLFGSTFVADPVKDGNTRVLNDSAYNAGTAVPNVTADQLTVDTTLAGGTNANDTANHYHHLGDLTLNSSKLKLTGSGVLFVRGVITLSGADALDLSEGGNLTGAGFIGSSVSGVGSRIFPVEVAGSYQWRTTQRQGNTNYGANDAFPTVDIVNNGGNTLSGIPNNMCGTGGPVGASTTIENIIGQFPEYEALSGATTVVGGAGWAIVCRGFIIAGSGQINTSGKSENPRPVIASQITGQNETAGESGHGAPGGLLILLDGGTSPIPIVMGRVKALGNKGNDLKESVVRIQFVPEARDAVGDDPEDGDGAESVLIEFSVNGGFDNPPTYANFNGLKLSDIPSASEPTKGLVQKASDSEVLAGADNTKFITPLQFKNNFTNFDTSLNQTITGNWNFTKSTAFGSDITIGGNRRIYSSTNELWLSSGLATDANQTVIGANSTGPVTQTKTSGIWGTIRKIWHEGTFNPATKADLTGATFTGLTLHNAGLVGTLYGASSGAPDTTIWAVSPSYPAYGIFYNEGSPDKIEFKENGVVNAYIALNGAAHFKDYINAQGYRGNANIGGTGNACWFPEGFYSSAGKHVWLYGSLTGYGQLWSSLGNLRPKDTNVHDLGYAGNAWRNLYCNSNLIQGQDFVRPNVTWSQSGVSTGAIVIKIPGGESNYGMIHAELTVYEYHSSKALGVIYVGGHNWAGKWYNVSCSTVGNTDKRVRLAFVDGQYAIILGDTNSTWDYGSVRLTKFSNGTYYSNKIDVDGAWSIAQQTSISSTYITAYIDKKVYDYDSFGQEHTYFSGAGNSGHLFARHINGKASDSRSHGALYLNYSNAQAVNVGSTSTKSSFWVHGDINVYNSVPRLCLRDVDSAGATQAGWVSYQDSSGGEKAWVGFGSSGNMDLTMNNNIGHSVVSTSAAGMNVSIKPEGVETILTSKYAVDIKKNLYMKSNDIQQIKDIWWNSDGGLYTTYNNNYFLKCHGNGNVTLSAAGSNLYLGYQNTGKVLLQKDLWNINGGVGVLGSDGSWLKLTHTDKTISVDASKGSLTIDTSSSGSNTALGAQAGAISVGESGQGGASIHMTYTGDGYGHIGMGALGTDSVPDNSAIRLFYLTNNCDFNGSIRSTMHGAFTPRYDTAFYVLQSDHWYGHSSSSTMYVGETSNSVRLRGALFLDTAGKHHYMHGRMVTGSTNANCDAGIYGAYDSTKTHHIWSMGTSYRVASNGSNFGNLYGFGYKHQNNGTGGLMAGGHQAVWCENGTPRCSIGTNFWTAGTITAVGIVTAADQIATSDIRFKSNIRPIADALDNVDLLKGCSFNRSDMGGRRHAGTIAQDWERVLPEAVIKDDSKKWQVSAQAQIGFLVECIKELKREVTELKHGKR